MSSEGIGKEGVSGTEFGGDPAATDDAAEDSCFLTAPAKPGLRFGAIMSQTIDGSSESAG